MSIHPKRRQAPSVPTALTNFAELPDDAHVRVPVVAALFACSENSVWRRSRLGLIPAPVKIGPQMTAWNVGALRTALAKLKGGGQ